MRSRTSATERFVRLIAHQARAAVLDYLGVTLSHPRWLVSRWLDRYGFEATERWARFNNTPAPLVLRVNVLRTRTPTLIAQLEALGVEVEPARYAPDGLIVRSGNPLTTPLAGSGLFLVQDESSQLAGVFAGAQPGSRTLDLCAAPGNKTLALAADMDDRGVLVACDLRARRIDLLRRTIATLQVLIPRIVRADALVALPFRDPFDLVVIDAPCSGLGTIRRDPDIRWRRTPGELPKFADAQLRMLENVASVVRAGGRLVYATCSSEPEENEEVVEEFLHRHHDFRWADPRTPGRPRHAGVEAVVDAAGYLRPLPWIHGLEPFFAEDAAGGPRVTPTDMPGEQGTTMKPGEAKLPHLFQPASLGRFPTPNRVKYGACCVSNYNTRDGFVTEREIARMRVIARTGCGIVTNQGAYPDPRGEGEAYFRQLAIFDDRFLPELERIAADITANGAVAVQKILHAGRYGGIDLGYCIQPSDVPQTLPHFRPPQVMTKEDIRDCVAQHADAARRAIRAGFDGTEITTFMGYLLANFNSRFTNQPSDEYGGSIANRGRFIRELIDGIKQATPDRQGPAPKSRTPLRTDF